MRLIMERCACSHLKLMARQLAARPRSVLPSILQHLTLTGRSTRARGFSTYIHIHPFTRILGETFCRRQFLVADSVISMVTGYIAK